MASKETTQYKWTNLDFETRSRTVIARAIDERMTSGRPAGRAAGDAGTLGMSAKQVVEGINAELGYDSDVDPKHVTDWRRGRSFVPIRLWQVLGIVLWDNPTRIAQLAGVLPNETENLSETLTLHHSLARLRAQHANLAGEVAASPSRATARLVEALGRANLQGKWWVAVSPAFEGPAGYKMHVADRIDFRRADGNIPKKEDLETDLQEEFGLLNVQPSRFTPGRWAPPAPYIEAHPNATAEEAAEAATKTKNTDPYLRYSIGFTASSFPPPIALPYRNFRSISVVTAEAILWPNDVGAMLARLLGFGFTSTESIARTNYGFGYREQMTEQTTLVHRQLLAQPWRRYVWSHSSAKPPQVEVADLLPMPDQVPPGHLIILLLPVDPENLSDGREDGFYGQLLNRVRAIHGNDSRVLIRRMTVVDRRPGHGREAKWDRTFRTAFALRRDLHQAGILTDADYQFARTQLAARRTHNVSSALASWDSKNS